MLKAGLVRIEKYEEANLQKPTDYVSTEREVENRLGNPKDFEPDADWYKPQLNPINKHDDLKVGDKVVLIEESPTTRDEKLELGKIYTVTKIDEDMIGVKDDDTLSCLTSRFAFVPGSKSVEEEVEDLVETSEKLLSDVKKLCSTDRVSVGDRLTLVEESPMTIDDNLKLGVTYTIGRKFDNMIGVEGGDRFYLRTRFAYAKEEGKPYPRFEWSNDGDGRPTWILQSINEVKDKYLPMVDNIKNHDFSNDDIEYIKITNLSEDYLVKVKDQCLCAINEPGYTEWFTDYLNYVMACIQWQLDKD